MPNYITLYFISLVIFTALDFLWLTVIAKEFYAARLGHLLGPVVWQPAILFYLLFIGALTFFITYPLLQASTMKVILTGAFFGFITYATYDLTNHATLRDWPYVITLVDMAWGTFLGAFVPIVTILVYRMFS